MLENFFKYIDEKEVKKNGNFYKIKIKGDSLGGQAMNDLAMSAKYIIYHEINENSSKSQTTQSCKFQNE